MLGEDDLLCRALNGGGELSLIRLLQFLTSLEIVSTIQKTSSKTSASLSKLLSNNDQWQLDMEKTLHRPTR